MLSSFGLLKPRITRDGNVEPEMLTGIVKPASVFWKLGPIWSLLASIPLDISLRLYHSIVVRIVAYASETGAMLVKCTKKLSALHQRTDKSSLLLLLRDQFDEGFKM